MMKYIQMFIIPLLVPVMVGIGSAAVTGTVMMVRIEERVSNLEKSMARHEASLAKDFSRHEGTYIELTRRTDTQETRLSKVEGTLEALSKDTSEIKTDIKTLLREK